MIEIKHGRCTLKIKPEHAQEAHDLLAIIDKSKGKRGLKFSKPKGNDKFSSSRRNFPQFNPRVMLTSDYITAYAALNSHVKFIPCAFEPGVNRTPPMLDPTTPEVVVEVEA